MSASQTFISLIRELIREELQKIDSTELCIIRGVSETGNTVDISLVEDKETIIPNIINASNYVFQEGDIGVLYKIKNQIGNAFVIAKANP